MSRQGLVNTLLQLTALTLGFLLTGCAIGTKTTQTNETHAIKQTILLTLSVEHFRESSTAVASQKYHTGTWQVPLYTRSLARKLAARYGLRQLDAWPIRVLKLYCVELLVPPGIDAVTLIASLQSDPNVHSAQKNQYFVGMTTSQEPYDDPLFDVQYGEYTKAVRTLHNTSTGREVRVGVIDSNVDTTHPDLRGQIQKNYQLVDAADPLSRLHGTAVAGIIGAAADNGEGVVGLAPDARMFVYGACGRIKQGMRCTSFALAKAFAHALEDRVNILNVSLAGPQDPLLAALITKAVEQQVVVIAAHNPGDETRNFPASHPDVHAANDNNKLWFARNEQMSTQAGGGYQVFTGTSITAAGLSGGAALLRSQHSASETNTILQLLNDSNCNVDLNQIHLLLSANGCE